MDALGAFSWFVVVTIMAVLYTITIVRICKRTRVKQTLQDASRVRNVIEDNNKLRNIISYWFDYLIVKHNLLSNIL